MLLKTVSLDNAIQEFSLAQPSWVMLYKYVWRTQIFWDGFIFILF